MTRLAIGLLISTCASAELGRIIDGKVIDSRIGDTVIITDHSEMICPSASIYKIGAEVRVFISVDRYTGERVCKGVLS